MYRGSAISTDNTTIYVAPFNSYDIYCYQVKEDVWSEHQNRCPQKNFGLVVFGNKLTAVGGENSGDVTDKVLTLQQGKWIEELPPLAQACSDPAIVSTDSHLLTIGGYAENRWSSSVDLLCKGDRNWTSLSYLPTRTARPSATLIGKNIYIMANLEHSFFSSLADVLANKKPLPRLTWHSLLPFPPIASPCAFIPSSCSLGGQLVIVTSDGAIYQLLRGKWEKCGNLSGTDRHLCLLASPSSSTMVAVGAVSSSGDDKVTVDVCMIV